jgi:toxin ParE1/3/4
MPYRLSPLSEQDLDEIWSYVAEDASLTTADRLIDDIVHRFELLAEQPGIGRIRPEFGIGMRSFPVENYVVYYRREGDDVLIARILHGRRDQIAAWSESS